MSQAKSLLTPSRLGSVQKRLSSPTAFLGALGIFLLLLSWYVLVDLLHVGRFALMPGIVEVITEWTSRDPLYGVSIFTPDYYSHILASVQRVTIAFTLALCLGIPLGLAMGWSQRTRDYIFPIFELIRPIPILAWVPLAILMFGAGEIPVLFLTFLAAFYVTTLNTILGVTAIDRDLIRAATSLGSRPLDTFRHVIVPGALPYIFTGLQIAMGAAWFSLVAGEIIAGQYGLGYLINYSYTTTRYPTIFIAMATLGAFGYLSSVLIRLVGRKLMAYRARAMGGA